MNQNQLKEIPDLSQMTKLNTLKVSDNQIELINNASEALLPSSLVELELGHNRIKIITKNTFKNLDQLKFLNLGSNQISQIEANAFVHLRKLESLNLAKNFIKHIPAHIFYTLANLERVDLSDQNQMLRSIEDFSFDRQNNSITIKKIDLSKNRITKIGSKAFCSLNLASPYTNVKEIDLASNPLHSINPCVLRQLTRALNQHNPSVWVSLS